jgi:hypothetical protein
LYDLNLLVLDNLGSSFVVEMTYIFPSTLLTSESPSNKRILEIERFMIKRSMYGTINIFLLKIEYNKRIKLINFQLKILKEELKKINYIYKIIIFKLL